VIVISTQDTDVVAMEKQVSDYLADDVVILAERLHLVKYDDLVAVKKNFYSVNYQLLFLNHGMLEPIELLRDALRDIDRFLSVISDRP
jgi:hypothetical protein